MKKRNILFSLILTTSLVVICILTIFSPQKTISLEENRKLSTFIMPDIKNVIDGSFQTTFEKAVSDQFVNRHSYINNYTSLNAFLKNIIAITQNKDMSLVSISDDGIYKVSNEGSWLAEFPFLKEDGLISMLEKRIFNYNEIQKYHDDTDFFLFKVTNSRDTNFFDTDNEILGAGNFYSSWIQKEIHPSISYHETLYNSFEEYKLYNYKTDHHWNAEGAKKGYKELITQISSKYPQIGLPKDSDVKLCSGVQFYGSYAKRSNYNIDLNEYDTLCDYVYELDEHEIFINGEQVEQLGLVDEYLNDIYEDDIKVNHYREMFGADKGEVVFDFGDNTGVNALIISDSYSNAIKPVVASHFDKTHYVDLRHYELDNGRTFNLKHYLIDNDIDFVVYMGGLFNIYMEEIYMINLY